MATYTVSVDRETIGTMRGFTLQTYQIERMKNHFAKEWGISPKGVTIESATTRRIKFEGKVK